MNGFRQPKFLVMGFEWGSVLGDYKGSSAVPIIGLDGVPLLLICAVFQLAGGGRGGGPGVVDRRESLRGRRCHLSLHVEGKPIP